MKQNVNLKVLCVLILVAITLSGCWLEGRPVRGNIAGELVDASGQRVGYTSAVLKIVETGKNVVSGIREYQQYSQNPGLFFFGDLDGGTYSIEFLDHSGTEIPVEPFEVLLGNGRTKTIVVQVLPDEK